MFNIEESRKLKERFIESDYCNYDEQVKFTVARMFKRAETIEIDENYDLSMFNSTQVYRLLKYFNSTSKSYLTLVCFYFNRYFLFCLQEGFIDGKNVKNYYANNFSKSIIDDVIPIEVIQDKYIPSETIHDYMNMFDDYVIKLLLYSPYIGIWGNSYEEILGLKLSDLNENEKTITLVSGRLAKVDDTFIQIIKKAEKETWYHPEGIEEARNYKDSRLYLESKYVIKSASKKAVGAGASHTIIMSKYRDIQRIIGNKMINCGNLYLNGLINFIKQKHETNGVTLKQVFTEKSGHEYAYEKETQQYIEEFGSKIAMRMLRYRLKDFIDLF